MGKLQILPQSGTEMVKIASYFFEEESKSCLIPVVWEGKGN